MNAGRGANTYTYFGWERPLHAACGYVKGTLLYQKRSSWRTVYLHQNTYTMRLARYLRGVALGTQIHVVIYQIVIT